MKDVDKARFLDAPISQVGLFGDTVEGFAQQFSAVQQQTEAIQHILPRRDAASTAAPGARPQSSQVKSSHLYLYSAFNNTNCNKATAQYQNRKIVSIT